MVQRAQALSAKKWYVRDNPKATGYTVEDLSGMSVKSLAKNMVGYTASIPGTRASKAQLRRVILTMVKQIEIETASTAEGQKADAATGDVPSLFGTLTSQRYQWDDIISIIAQVAYSSMNIYIYIHTFIRCTCHIRYVYMYRYIDIYIYIHWEPMNISIYIYKYFHIYICM